MFGTKVTCGSLRSVLVPFILGKGRSDKHKMMSLSNRDSGRCARWCALVVLLAVCSLTISVATRYSSPENVSNSITQSLHKQTSEEPSRQRLTNDATTWVPPRDVCTVLYAPAPYLPLPLTDPDVPSPAFVSSLYYRPPPSSFTL